MQDPKSFVDALRAREWLALQSIHQVAQPGDVVHVTYGAMHTFAEAAACFPGMRLNHHMRNFSTGIQKRYRSVELAKQFSINCAKLEETARNLYGYRESSVAQDFLVNAALYLFIFALATQLPKLIQCAKGKSSS